MAERLAPFVAFGGVGVAVVIAAAGLLTTAGPMPAVLLWAGLMVVGQSIKVPAPGRSSLHVGIGAAAAVPLLLPEPAAVAATYTLGLLGSWVVGMLRGEDRNAAGDSLLAEMLALAAYGSVFFAIHGAYGGMGIDAHLAEILGVTAGAVAWFAGGAAAQTLIGIGEQGRALRYQWLQSMADWPVVLSLFASGSLFAFAYPVIGMWAIPTAIMPYGFSHVAFVRYSGTRITYGQTIRALARIPEVAGLAGEGHSTRSADLAVAIGQDIGLTPAQVTELEYAALMHDIGRITLNEPAILKAGYTDQDIARWGSQIIAEAPYLQRVAEFVRQQHAPYRRPGEQWDESLPLPSKIIKVASAYDQAVVETGLPAIEAVEVLHRGAAYDFDPKVVRSLRRVIAHRGEIAY